MPFRGGGGEELHVSIGGTLYLSHFSAYSVLARGYFLKFILSGNNS